MKFIVFLGITHGMYIFLMVHKKTSIWSYSRRKVENCLICRSYKLDCFLFFCMYCLFEMLNRGVCGMRPVDHHDWHWNLVRDQITSSLSLPLSMCRASWFNSIRFDFCLKNKRINKHWNPNATSLSFKAYRFFFLLSYHIESNLSVGNDLRDRCLCDWSRSTHKCSIYTLLRLFTSRFCSLVFVFLFFALFRVLCMHSSFAFDSAVKRRPFEVPWRTTAIIVSYDVCPRNCKHACMHACVYACCQLEVLNSCMAIIWL